MKCEMDHGLSIMKPITNSHRHDRTEVNAASKPVQAGTPDFVKRLKERHFDALPLDLLSRIRGQALSLPLLTRKGFFIPILIDTQDGLELSLPDGSFSLQEVVQIIGPDYMLDVIDSRRQMSLKMTAEEFCRLATRSTEHDSIYNCISLEVSQTELDKRVRPPAIVNKLSWVDKCWPRDEQDRPRVSKYCLMSMEGSYTDFHVDFGGTSVWYHVIKGSKVFYVIEPTQEHLKEYEKWMHLNNHSEVFLGDIIPKCYRVDVKEGNTLLIPSGWIHAVLTPSDSIVFGGNFLHSLDMAMQLGIHEMELRIRTPDKFQFPYFEVTHWYATPFLVKMLQDNQVPPKHLVQGIEALLPVLSKWAASKPEEGLYPVGLNCRRMIKDLKRMLKKANRKLNPVAAAMHIPVPSIEHKERRNDDDASSSDSERELVIDQVKSKPGVIRMKLSLCGKSGLPEVTEATLTEPSKQEEHDDEDQEILDMIKDRPQDDDFIYLDVEEDPEEESGSKVRDDYSWNPRAKVVIRGSPKEARPVRENAKREVIEECMAGAAARLEQQDEQERMMKLKRKRESSSGFKRRASRASSQESSSTSKEAGPSSSSSSQVPRPKKGEKTPKQRLAKLLGIRK